MKGELAKAFCGLIVAVLLVVAHFIFGGEPAEGAGVVFRSRPSGAQVLMLKPALRISPRGEASGGVRELPLGRTPEPLQLRRSELPARLVFRLAGYEDTVLSVSPEQFAGGSHYPAEVKLSPRNPLVPVGYFVRDYFLILLSAVPLGWALRSYRLWCARKEEREKMGQRHRQREFRPGDTIHGYVLEELAGRGGAAAVYRARAPGGKAVAFKLLRAGERSKSELGNEARLGQKLVHPHLLPLLDWGSYLDQHYLVYEYLEGGSLADRDCPDLEAARALLGVARALDALHRHGYVHRDIKPGNVLFDSRGKAYLSDFGLAGREGTATSAGTLGYAPPERLSEKEEGRAGDLYSFGAVLYFALTGRPPFEASTPAAVLRLQHEGSYPPLTDFGVAGPLAGFVHGLLEVEPSARPGEGWVERLEELLKPGEER